MDVLAEWGSLYVLTRDGKIHVLQEKDTQTKLEARKSVLLFTSALCLQDCAGSADWEVELFRSVSYLTSDLMVFQHNQCYNAFGI